MTDLLAALRRGGVLVPSEVVTAVLLGSGTPPFSDEAVATWREIEVLEVDPVNVVSRAASAPASSAPAVDLAIWAATPDEEVDAAALAQRLYEPGCRYAYWRQQGDEPVPAALARGWWMHEVRGQEAKTPSLRQLASANAPPGASRYRHWIGWRRLVPAA